MITTDQIQELLSSGGTVVGNDGGKIGRIGEVYLDDETGRPEWVTASTGLFGTSETFIPLSEATVSGDTVTVPYDKDTVKNAPRMDDRNGHLSREDEDGLYQYYGLAYSRSQDSGYAGVGQQQDLDQETTRQRDLADDSGVEDRTSDDAMTRSEEQLRVGTETVESGKVRLRKYVVTENVTTTVPVSHEEVRVEREPVTDAKRSDALVGDDLTSEEQEVTLHEERPVVDKETVPVERVRLETETVTDEEQVSEEVRKEQIETDGLEGRRTDGTGDMDRKDR